MFDVKQRTLPHTGVSPGARGHKKIEYKPGTKVWVIQYNDLYFWACYQTEVQAIQCACGLIDTVEGKSRRCISLRALLDFNFHPTFPTRVVRL